MSYKPNDDIIFAAEDEEVTFVEEEATSRVAVGSWKIMIVDDEFEIHNITRLSLLHFIFEQKGLTFISAYSGAEAAQLIQDHPDTALILLDVVMETEDAGLSLVKYIRETLGNQSVRIILRTGQPGQAPEEKVIVDYDINDYKAKTELTTQKLFTTVVAALRAYRHITTIERLTAEKLRLETELTIARQLQQMLLPTEEELRQIEELDIAGFMEPAAEAGGDYYDVLQHDGQVQISIGDVTGYGLESSVVMLMAQMGVRTLLTSAETDPTRFLNIVNQTIFDNVQRMRADKSLRLALLDYQAGKLKLSGQHKEVMIILRGGQVTLSDDLASTIPLRADNSEANLVAGASVQLQPGDGVVLYTGGLIQARNKAGELYGLERLRAVVSRHWDQPAEAIKQAVIKEVHRHIGQQKVADDLILLVLKQK